MNRRINKTKGNPVLGRGFGFFRLLRLRRFPGAGGHVVGADRAGGIDGPGLTFHCAGTDGGRCFLHLHQRQQIGLVHLIEKMLRKPKADVSGSTDLSEYDFDDEDELEEEQENIR